MTALHPSAVLSPTERETCMEQRSNAVINVTVTVTVAAPYSKVTADGRETVVHLFNGGSDGISPSAGLIRDRKTGNFYGTTQHGGPLGYGTVFEITPRGAETVLYSFLGNTDGVQPWGGVLMDGQGILYGTTLEGGNTGCLYNLGCGTVFALVSD